MLSKQNESLKLDSIVKSLKSEFTRGTQGIKSGKNERISRVDSLLSSFALFHQKSSSLLSFENNLSNEVKQMDYLSKYFFVKIIML